MAESSLRHSAAQSNLPTHGRFKNITGRVFARLTVISFSYMTKQGAFWLCRCECGTELIVRAGNLPNGMTKSCGCLSREILYQRNTKHGLYGTPEYRSWRHMIDRCTNENDTAYYRYGGRGITVCARWRESFETFYADMGPRPGYGYEIDRENNDGNYEPGNCRWVRKKANARNRSTNRMIEFDGMVLCLMEWSDITGIPESAIRDRMKRGWSIKDALTKPLRKQRRPTQGT